MIRTRFVRSLVVLVVLATALAAGPAAFAYYTCSDTITVYASGGYSCERTCYFYDNETGAYQGSISREYQC